MDVHSQFSSQQQQHHINAKEMLAVLFALKHFIHLLSNKSINIRTDNITTMFYVNRMGGRSAGLASIAQRIFTLCRQRNITLQAVYLPGKDNIIADRLSRQQSADSRQQSAGSRQQAAGQAQACDPQIVSRQQ